MVMSSGSNLFSQLQYVKKKYLRKKASIKFFVVSSQQKKHTRTHAHTRRIRVGKKLTSNCSVITQYKCRCRVNALYLNFGKWGFSLIKKNPK